MERAQYAEPKKGIAEQTAKYAKAIARSIPVRIP
jgi:hypothetical protein